MINKIRVVCQHCNKKFFLINENPCPYCNNIFTDQIYNNIKHEESIILEEEEEEINNNEDINDEF